MGSYISAAGISVGLGIAVGVLIYMVTDSLIVAFALASGLGYVIGNLSS